MVKYACDWCEREFTVDRISTVKVSNVYNKPFVCHICRDCGRDAMPGRLQDMLSWTR